MSDDRVKCFLLEPTGREREWTADGGGTCSAPIYRRKDTGEEMEFKDAPAGAMVRFPWGLTVKLPNGRSWNIDGECNNCTRKGDRSHRCWCRHGEPPDITVNKQGCETCAAGGGSIQAGDYHGMLEDGFLRRV